MDKPVEFSVIVSNYNYAAYVCEAISSALAQEAAAEVVVVDDGSTDDSVHRVQQRFGGEPRVSIVATPNRGQLAAFITGATAAKSTHLAFLDADDTWHPQYLERVSRVYVAHPQIEFVYTNMAYFGQRQGPVRKDLRTRDLGLSILFTAFHTHYQGLATSALTLKRDLALRILDLPAEMHPRWKTCADYALVAGADILGGRKFYLAEPLANYRVHGQNRFLSTDDRGGRKLVRMLREQALVEHYRRAASLSPECIRFAKHEFRSKPAPNWKDVRQYWALLSMGRMPWALRLEQRVAIAWHWLKSRRAKVR